MEHPTATLQADALAPVDTTSGVPIYRQIAEQLAALLEGLAVGTRLPSEAAIARRAGVSRGTAVQALRELEHRDLVVRVQGSGTFKASPTPGSFTRSLDAGKLPSFSEDLERAGHATREQIARCARAAADDETAAALGLEPGAPIWTIERTVLADERPVVHIVSALRADRYPEIDADAIASGSLYAFLERRYGADGRPTWADEEYSALNAGSELCATLAVPADRAILCSRRVAYLADGQAVELVHSYMRADAYRVRVTLLPGDGDASAARELELRAELPSGGAQA